MKNLLFYKYYFFFFSIHESIGIRRGINIEFITKYSFAKKQFFCTYIYSSIFFKHYDSSLKVESTIFF